jgi:hypothetical protein
MEALGGRAKQVVHPICCGEDTNVKRSSVVADLSGVSGRCIRAASIAGERDPHALAALATRRLRRTLAPLEVALTGQFTPLCPAHAGALDLMDLPDRHMADLNQPMGDLAAPPGDPDGAAQQSPGCRHDGRTGDSGGDRAG